MWRKPWKLLQIAGGKSVMRCWRSRWWRLTWQSPPQLTHGWRLIGWGGCALARRGFGDWKPAWMEATAASCDDCCHSSSPRDAPAILCA